MAFFKNFNFARFIILAGVVGSVALAYMAYEVHEKNVGARAALEPGGEVEVLVRQIQSNSRLATSLSRLKANEGLAGGEKNEMISYVRRWSAHPEVGIGDVNVKMNSRAVARNIEDHNVVITPQGRTDRPFQRVSIANYLYRLEQKSSRVRVTDLHISYEDSKLKPHQVPPNDRWTFSATVTSRQKTD